MGSYTDFKIGEYSLLSTKSDVVPTLMTLFRETDRVDLPAEKSEYEDSYETYLYRASVAVVRDRLGVLGFSLERTRSDFTRCKADEEARLLEWSEESDSEHWREDLRVLSAATFEDYVNGFRLIKERGLRRSYFGEETAEGQPGFVRFMLEADDDGDGDLFHFPCSDIRYLVRAFLEVCEDGEQVCQDVSELTDAGYYESTDKVCDLAISELAGDYPVNSKIIVLTEGSSDKLILENALELLYPHLVGFYSFMDFTSSNAPGGTGAVISNVKAFAGSGITNRVVALLDNDTAGKDAVRALGKITLPDNIRVLRYPDSSTAASYPTLGPTGMVNLNVNGLATSIELFLGRDVLSVDGELSPIQWTGYNSAVGRYQGEILNKALLHTRYFDKISLCKRDRALVAQHDFEDMKSLLTALFRVFQ